MNNYIKCTIFFIGVILILSSLLFSNNVKYLNNQDMINSITLASIISIFIGTVILLLTLVKTPKFFNNSEILKYVLEIAISIIIGSFIFFIVNTNFNSEIELTNILPQIVITFLMILFSSVFLSTIKFDYLGKIMVICFATAIFSNLQTTLDRILISFITITVLAIILYTFKLNEYLK
jgi:hypothetical protein